LYETDDATANLQLGVTVISGDRDRNLMQKTVTMCWFPSRKPLSPLSKFDKAEKWQPARSGLLTSSGKAQ